MENQITREKLIALCEKSIVPVEKWADKDSVEAQKQIGMCWILLKCGCEFKAETNEPGTEIDCWITHSTPYEQTTTIFLDNTEVSYFFIPTQVKLDRWMGKDWYQ